MLSVGWQYTTAEWQAQAVAGLVEIVSHPLIQ